MELYKCLKTVKDIYEYIHFTRDVEIKGHDLKIPFNMSTVLSLKNIRSIEIEYFNKCEENGAATKIFEFMLRSPPSKTWSLLGKELVCLLQYWLEAIRKHLIIHNTQWWTFLKLILKFIKEIRSKDASLNKILIEETGDCILDLATHSVPEPTQRLEIVQTFNLFSAESSRNVRYAYKDNFQKYFTKLSIILSEAGDLRLQYSIMETLLRWLLPRHDRAVRQAAAARWFPPKVCCRAAVEVFLERPWQNFMRDARDFLNARNESTDLVTSVICKKFTIGSVSIAIDFWLDVNSSTKSLSLLLEPKFLEELRVKENCDVMVITDENTCSVELDRESSGVVIKVTVLEISQVYPFDSIDSNIISFDVNARSDVPRLDRALRTVFKDKYRPLFDVNIFKPSTSLASEQEDYNANNNLDDNVRFSIPAEVPRRKHSGYLIFRKRNESRKSPSTVSTSSLAQLHEKLAALPPFSYDKELVSVCALPQLSNVTEVSETEENRTVNTSTSTVKLRPRGASSNKFGKPITKSSQSTSEESQESRAKILSPVRNDDENSVSCLLLATLGSNDDSVISETINQLPKGVPCNTDNIVELLVQEALQYNTDKQDTGINIADKINSEDCQQSNLLQQDNIAHKRDSVIEPFKNLFANEKQDNLNKLATIDESSNEIVDTPLSYVNIRRSKRIAKNKSKLAAEPFEVTDCVGHHDVQVVEDFFSKHFTENRDGELVISPTLAKKINETSSECSDDFEFCPSPNYVVQDIDLDPTVVPDLDIIECLNEMVDKVCQDFDKCTKYLNMEGELIQIINDPPTEVKEQENVAVTSKSDKNQEIITKENTSKAVKLKYTRKMSLSCKKILEPNIKVDNKQTLTILSPIIEKDSVVDDSVRTNVVSPAMRLSETEPLLRRKRKLYSPKNEQSHKNTVVHITESAEEDTTNSELKTNIELNTKPDTTPKTTATSYKEIETERKRVRKPRTRRSKINMTTIASPRTQKLNQIFDSLKDVSNGETVKLVDKNLDQNLAVYNYTSGSDVEEVMKQSDSNTGLVKTANIAAGSVKPKKARARRAKIQTTATKTTTTSNNDTKKPTKNLKRKPKQTTKRKLTKTQKEPVTEIIEPNLEDERMRKGTPEILNTSVVIEVPDNEKYVEKEPVPILIDVPQMEYITEGKPEENNQNKKESHGKPKSRNMLSLKRNKDVVRKAGSDVSNERTVSPMPGLVVETVLITDEDLNDLNSSNMLQKFKDIYQGNKVVESDVNTTHNLLSDIEPINDIPNLNFTEELNISTDVPNDLKGLNKSRDNKSVKENNVKSIKTSQMRLKREPSTKFRSSADLEVIQLTCSSVRAGTEKSMATQGNKSSPITGHGDFNENPPNTTLLKDDIEPRLVEEENYSNSLKDFFMKLNTELYESNDIRSEGRFISSSGKESNGQLSSKDGSVGNRSIDGRSNCSHSDKLPVVVLSRISPDLNLISGSDFTSNKLKVNSDIPSASSTKETNNMEVKIKESNKTPTKNMSNLISARKTMISPIRLSEDFIVKNDTPKSTHSEKDSLKRIDETEVYKASHKSNKSRQTNESMKRLRYNSVSSKDSVASKRKSSPILGSSKRSKFELNNNEDFESADLESGPSLQSVDEWFKRKEPACAADSIKFTIKENTKNLLEKLDTTLVEIHHNTSKRFINMFVNAQKDFKKLKEKRRELYKETASKIMSQVVKIMDAEFTDLDKRSQSMDEEFMCALKKQSQELLREDSKQKRVMVTLLREDVQAVLDHMNQ